MGCSRSLLYELIAAGELGYMKIGRLTRIPLSALEDLIARRMEVTRRRTGTGGAAGKANRAYAASHRGGRRNRRRGGDR
jgi:excisionase family DNA binding protein